MRILIVGAGIAGLTLAALLKQRGVDPVLVERQRDLEHAGYMLGLYPLGGRVLHGLGLYERLAAASIEARCFELYGGSGILLNAWPMDIITNRLGPVLITTRPFLVRTLYEGTARLKVRFGATPENLQQSADEVRVAFNDGTTEAFDLVVGADGVHSWVRHTVFGEQPCFDTGWGGWVWWADGALLPADTFVLYAGVNQFIAAFPTSRGTGVFAVAPIADGYGESGPGRRARVRKQFARLGPRVDAFLDALPNDEEAMYFWKVADVRSAEWVCGRVALLGDAATAILPTLGLGASMAMESAAVLNDELSRTNNRFLARALRMYVERRRRRVEGVQHDTRKFASLMFASSPLLAALHHLAVRFYSLDMFAPSLTGVFDRPI